MTVSSQLMLECMAHGNPVYLPSKFWEYHNDRNRQQLETEGFENLKRTLARNYFTWLIGREDAQFKFLVRNTPLHAWPGLLAGALAYVPGTDLPRRAFASQSLFTRMLWKFAESRDGEGLLKRLAEPAEGNPLPFRMGGKLISQDLANSVLEYSAMREHFRPAQGTRPVICELGAGYGRDAYVFVQAVPGCRYVVVDIPPALEVSQRYLTAVLPDRKVFGFRCFERFEDVREEFEAADIAFLLPHQAAMLPSKSVDLFVNISSLHEMTRDQIQAYVDLIDRLTRGWFYSKQWWVSHNNSDGVVIRQDEYPIPAHWRQLYLREAPVQTYFFEAMYEVGSAAGGAHAAPDSQ
ncbi:MAG TPA: putative sugar O-methyltransferase [Longimicrobium sp.]|jgi:putative sugar O-methyltransferase|uniref:putative sugar O-methyltransferase n=1 Tax=Longimicrobium sp. TaxID=2029185 RepID=UPI002ED7B6D0